MKKKIKVFALLTVLLCVFAASALADIEIEGVQLWEGGLIYAKTPLRYSFDNNPVYLVEVTSDGDMVVDYNDLNSWIQRPISDYDIPDGWRIPTKEEMADLFNTTKHGTSYQFSNGLPVSCTITGNNETLTLLATGSVGSQSEVDPATKDTTGLYATTGEFLYFDQNSSSCS
ncbi:MAG: hypothetical protein MJ142_06355, partial [Clostridia bacterium]|nr:hypothetical protein [Clostridia bacterium]